MFPNPWVHKAVLTPSDMSALSKYYKYARIHGSISNSLKLFSFFTWQNMRTLKIGRIADVLPSLLDQFVQTCILSFLDTLILVL